MVKVEHSNYIIGLANQMNNAIITEAFTMDWRDPQEEFLIGSNDPAILKIPYIRVGILVGRHVSMWGVLPNANCLVI
jgi:hypothetical protein